MKDEVSSGFDKLELRGVSIAYAELLRGILKAPPKNLRDSDDEDIRFLKEQGALDRDGELTRKGRLLLRAFTIMELAHEEAVGVVYEASRREKLIPGGVPRWIRVYDNGGGYPFFCRKCLKFYDARDKCPDCGGPVLASRKKGTCDRYTVVYTGRYRHKTGGQFMYVGMSERPFHPQGFGQHGFSDNQPDVGATGFPPAVGDCVWGGNRRITFEQLPEQCKEMVLADYRSLWDLD